MRRMACRRVAGDSAGVGAARYIAGEGAACSAEPAIRRHQSDMASWRPVLQFAASFHLSCWSNMPITVRPADFALPADRTTLVHLTDLYARDAMGGGTGLSAHAQAHLADALAAHPGLFAVIAERDGQAVGHAMCILGFSTFAAAPLCNVHDLSVIAAARGLGIGRLLMAAVEQAARARGCAKVTLEVREDNEIGRTLYASTGFAVSGLGGASYLMMEKKLAA
jgi:ribosomal protein S18 acetylase RimI-like enzyme